MGLVGAVAPCRRKGDVSRETAGDRREYREGLRPQSDSGGEVFVAVGRAEGALRESGVKLVW